MRSAWNVLERIGLFVMLPFTWLAELLLKIPEVERFVARILDWLISVTSKEER